MLKIKELLPVSFNTPNKNVHFVIIPLSRKDPSAPSNMLIAAVPVEQEFLGISRTILTRAREVRNSSAG